MEKEKTVIVIGSGASGMMAAGRAAELGAAVMLLEKMSSPASKLLLSGHTRCNLSNSRELSSFIEAYGINGRFLYSVFSRFFRDELLNLLVKYGVQTGIEGDGRIFPSAGGSRSVVRALWSYLEQGSVIIHTGVRVNTITTESRHVCGVRAAAKDYPARAVILATGGASYPHTGSNGDGYRMAAELKHHIIPLRPALVPLIVKEKNLVRSVQGSSLQDVRISAFQCPAADIPASLIPDTDSGRGSILKKPRPPLIASRSGDVMLTHFGLSGPATLQLSLEVVDALQHGPVSINIDMQPQLNLEATRAQLHQSLHALSNSTLRNLLKEYMPPKMVDALIMLTGIQGQKRCHQITSAERDRLLLYIKSFRFNIEASLPLSSAMVTAGGVSLKEINPATMASRLIEGLFFCGEVMDLDADTGGFNLQAAFSSGYLAGEKAAEYILGLP
jgi:predicted flavoprotein YhiN